MDNEETLAEVAARLVASAGKPYSFGGRRSEPFDAEDLAEFAQLGDAYPRRTVSQEHVGVAVPIEDAQPGDLVFPASPSPCPYCDSMQCSIGMDICLEASEEKARRDPWH